MTKSAKSRIKGGLGQVPKESRLSYIELEGLFLYKLSDLQDLGEDIGSWT